MLKGKVLIVKSERSDLTPPASAEANICLNCPLDDCKPQSCERLKKEKKKLLEVKRNDKQRKTSKP